MEKALGAVNFLLTIATRSRLTQHGIMVLSSLMVAYSLGQTSELTPTERLKRDSSLGAPQAAVMQPAPAAETSVQAAPPPAVSPEPAAPVAAPPSEKIAQGYLYVEAYQARFEALIDATRVLHWLNPLKPVPATLDAATQKSLIETASRQSATWCRLSTTQQTIPGGFITAAVIKGKPGATLPFEEGTEIPIQEAMVGFIWEFPTPPAPDQLTVEWRGFIEDIESLPIRVFFGAKSELLEASTILPKVTWKAQGRLPMPSPLASVPRIEVSETLRIPLASILWGIGGLAFYAFVRLREHHLPGGSLPFLFAWVLGAVLSWPILNVNVFGGADIPVIRDKAEAEKILTPLLRNVYRAFDHRSESEIYDVLAMSVDGELLRQLYLETIQALALEGREGTRVTISEFSVDLFQVRPDEESEGFVTECQWTALGNVGHWGHSHTRVNRYTAQVTIAPIQSAWKMIKLEVKEARRL